MRHYFLSLCLSLLLPLTCHAQTADPRTPELPVDTGEPAANVTQDTGIMQLLRSGRHPYLRQGNLSAELEVLQQVYQRRNGALQWFIGSSASNAALQLLQQLRDAASHGLQADHYDGNTLTYRLTNLADLSSEQQAAERVQIDVGLSVAALRLMRDLHFGRVEPRKLGFDLRVTRSKELDEVALLQTLSTAADVGAVVASVEPQFVHYQLLKAALTRYRQLAVDAELTTLPTIAGRSVKSGEQYQGAPALRRLLIAEQDMPTDAALPDTDTSLDPALTKALAAYQARHGLQADGALGKQTFAALTTPFASRVAQIELTLERWRWLPPLQSPMIVVNIPQFKLFAFKANDDREANLLRMDVIVGQAFDHTQTPVFLSDMKYVIFRPYWDVPPNIVKRELLASIQKDPAYLTRNEMELVNGQGDRSPVVPATAANIALLAKGALRVRQRPGDRNALGEVKFMLPNSYNVYLHSTPAKQLFTQSRRAFSHGCIRVSNPVALAEYVLRNAGSEWSTEQIKSAMSGEPNQRVNLQQNIPVLIVYGTAMPLESGVVQFFDDIYGHDARLTRLLKSQLK